MTLGGQCPCFFFFFFYFSKTITSPKSSQMRCFSSVHRKHKANLGPNKPVSQPRRNIVGCRIQHIWKEGSGAASQWKGTVLDQVPVNPSLYLIKYDGFDCVYGLELHKDERVQGLEVLPDRQGELT